MVTRASVSAALTIIVLSACASLPPQPADRAMSVHFDDLGSTALGRLAAGKTSPHGALTGVRILDTGSDALIQRAALIDAAERTFDAQYYIWNSDVTGQYMAERVYAAAERGVRVRLLIDDINVSGRDATIAALDSHRNIEIRIYNPFAARAGIRKMLGFASEFARLNRRMHNKSFTVDGAVTIVGGRNIGDEYFDADPEMNFHDRDVVAIGLVVGQVGEMFDAFWNSALSYPISELTKARLSSEEVDHQLSQAIAMRPRLTEMGYQLPADRDAAMAEVAESIDRFTWAPARLVHDTPPTEVAAAPEVQPTARALAELARGAKQEILIESAYLVLDDTSLAAIRDIRATGVDVRALTNSLASNDVTANHAAYARRRVPIVDSGIELHELRPDATSCNTVITIDGCNDGRVLGLHAKSFVIDHRTVYIGSLNMNLRSAYLNAETAMIIESEALASSLAQAIETNMAPTNSWRVTRLDGQLRWDTDRNGALEMTHEPDTSWWRRTKSGFIALFPLEKYF